MLRVGKIDDGGDASGTNGHSFSHLGRHARARKKLLIAAFVVVAIAVSISVLLLGALRPRLERGQAEGER